MSTIQKSPPVVSTKPGFQPQTSRHATNDKNCGHVPQATYRLQLNRSLTFADARRLVPYLAKLGISHCYVSPFLKARPGSPHGYDIVDHQSFNPEIGSESEFREFVATLHAHGLRLILDIVPNHMAVATSDNAWWMDVLENGPSSPYAGYFDIDWMPLKPDLANKVLLPVLGDQFGRVLEKGGLQLVFKEGRFSIQYFEQRFPIAARSSSRILKHRLEELVAQVTPDDSQLIEFQSILTAIGHLPPRTEVDRATIEEGRREQEVIQRRLNDVCLQSSSIRDFVTENVRLFNGSPGNSRSYDLLDELLLDQAYRLAYWRIAADEINYRRFFDINELAAICMESPAVFNEAHALVCRLVEERLVDGLRIDHPDGLYDPLDYFTKVVAAVSREDEATGFDNEAFPRVYLVVEKILGRGEHLPTEWPVHGTTGYDFLNAANGLFVDRSNAKTFDAIYAKFTQQKMDFKMLAYHCKKVIMDASMSSEISVLGHVLDRISEQDRSSRDFTLRGLTEAIREVIACFPVYRTYITAAGVVERDQRFLETAVTRAKRMNPAVNESIFDFVRDILMLKYPVHATEESRLMQQRFVSRFQQVTSPIMAKAVEDTAFYINNRLVSLNEVGGDPEKFGITPSVFHQQNIDRLSHWPNSLLASSTHDTKRSEDVRARVSVLSELPGEWKKHIFRWSRVNQKRKKEVDGEPAPSRNDEYMLYQILIGTWPLEMSSPDQTSQYIQRIQQYMLKACREAKVHTSWISPHVDYEQAICDFVSGILSESPSRGFLSTFVPFARRIAEFGIWNSVALTLLKLTCPGVPDFYQGTELWDFSLVDPDNRRPVDFALREQLLDELDEELEEGGSPELLSRLIESRHDGSLKLFVIRQLLKHRRCYPDVHAHGSYAPLATSGHWQDHICAFGRAGGDYRIITVVPRFLTQLLPQDDVLRPHLVDWEDTAVTLPREFTRSDYRNVLTGELVHFDQADGNVPVSMILGDFPLAVLSTAGD